MRGKTYIIYLCKKHNRMRRNGDERWTNVSPDNYFEDNPLFTVLRSGCDICSTARKYAKSDSGHYVGLDRGKK